MNEYYFKQREPSFEPSVYYLDIMTGKHHSTTILKLNFNV